MKRKFGLSVLTLCLVLVSFLAPGPLTGQPWAAQPVQAGPIDPDHPLPDWFVDQLFVKPCQSYSLPATNAATGDVRCFGFAGNGAAAVRIPEVEIVEVLPRYGLVGIPRAFSYRIDPTTFSASVTPVSLQVVVEGYLYRLSNYRVALMLTSGRPDGTTRYGTAGYGGGNPVEFPDDQFAYGNIRFRSFPGDGAAAEALNWMNYPSRVANWDAGKDFTYFGWRAGPGTTVEGLSQLPARSEIEGALGVAPLTRGPVVGSYWGAPIYDDYWAMPYFGAVATSSTSWNGAATRSGQNAFAVGVQTRWSAFAKTGWDRVEEWQHVDDDCTYPTPTPSNPNPAPTSCEEVWDWVTITPGPMESDWTYVAEVHREMLKDSASGGSGGVRDRFGLEFFQSQPLLTDR